MVVENDNEKMSLSVAQKLSDMYFKKYNVDIDEGKLQCLMYLTQRESLIIDPEKPILSEDFIAGKNIPYLKSVHREYKNIIKNSREKDIDELNKKNVEEKQ